MSPELVRHRFQALGSTCELLAVGLPPDALLAEEQWVRAAEARFSRFDRDSELTRFNRSAGQWIDVSAPMLGMLAAALDAWHRSDGLVNAAILPALVAAGYSRRFADGLTSPTAWQPQPASPLPDVLTVDASHRRARLRTGCALDFGGIAKGQLADEVAERLGANVLCNLGGDLRARGAGLGDAWQVGLPDGRTVALADGALGTSGTTRRRWGAGFHHLIDPRTGAPTRSDVEVISVASADALSAEIFAKTALLLGAEKRATVPARPRALPCDLAGVRASVTPEALDQVLWLGSRAAALTAFFILAAAVLSGVALRSSLVEGWSHGRELGAGHQFLTVLWIPFVLLHVGSFSPTALPTCGSWTR